MPIEIDPTPATATQTTETTITANALWIDRLSIDGSKRDAVNPSASATVTPYAVGNPNVFAGTSWTLATIDIYAASANIPEFGAALQAVETAMGAWHTYNVARQADLNTANTALTTAQASDTTAISTLNAAASARTAAFASRTSETDPLWVDADNAWKQATTANQQAQQAVATAAANVATAIAALADPANPKLQT